MRFPIFWFLVALFGGTTLHAQIAEPSAWYQNVRLRRSPDDIIKELDKAEPARFGFNENFRTDDAIWSAKLALGYAFVRGFSTNNPAALTVRESAFIPNVAFDRVTGGPANKETDILEFRLPYSAYAVRFEENRQHWWRSYRLAIAPVYATDHDLKSSVLGGEINFQPGIIQPGNSPVFAIGQFTALQLFGLRDTLEYRLQVTLHAEGGHVFDSGEKATLSEGDAYARIGPKALLEFRLSRGIASNAVKAFSIFVGGENYESVLSESPSTRLLRTGSRWEISKNASIDLEYRLGRVPLTAEKVESLNIGFGLKF